MYNTPSVPMAQPPPASTKSPFSPSDAHKRNQSCPSPMPIVRSDGTRLYRSQSVKFNTTRMNQSMAFRKASLAPPPPRPTHDTCHVPRLIKTPWELERHKRQRSAWKRAPNEALLPQHVFQNLPREVYDCILKQLEQLYFAQDQPCPSCYLKDLCSLSLTSRRWERATTLHMYGKVWVLSNDPVSRLPKLRVAGTSRLKLLRRTLRESKALARMVREIHMPDLQALYCAAFIDREEIVNVVASLVMACPNLERLVGFHIPYKHSFDRLSHALSTRPKLKERTWVMTDAHIEDMGDEDGVQEHYYQAVCEPTERFLELHANHASLSTLVLHQESARPKTDLTYRALIGTMKQLPLLRHLSLSGLSASSFSNLALNSLPHDLESLRLENLPGINDRGLHRFSSSPVVVSLKSITLVDLEITHLDVISGLLSPHLEHLERFSLTQDGTPNVYDNPDALFFQSATLKRIHWELRSQVGPPPTLLSPFAPQNSPNSTFPSDEPVACLATRVLAISIEDGLFPELGRIRAPYDPQGVLQSICKPLSTALLRSDTALFTAPPRPASRHSKVEGSFSTANQVYKSEDIYSPGGHTPTASMAGEADAGFTCSSMQFLGTVPEGRTDSAMGSPSSASFANNVKDMALTTSLAPVRSRLEAHGRILAARRNVYMVVRVVDPEENVRLEKKIGGFVGDLKSKIVYELKADRNREVVDEEDEDGHKWLTGIDDIMGEWESGWGRGDCRHAMGGRVRGKAVEVRDLFC